MLETLSIVLKPCATSGPLSAASDHRSIFSEGEDDPKEVSLKPSRFSTKAQTMKPFLLWDLGTSRGPHLHHALWSHKPSWSSFIFSSWPHFSSYTPFSSILKKLNLVGVQWDRKLWSDSLPMFPNLLPGFWDSKAKSQLLCSLLFSSLSYPFPEAVNDWLRSRTGGAKKYTEKHCLIVQNY